MKKFSFYTLLLILCVFGFGVAIYKSTTLGYPIVPNEKGKVWVCEAKVSFFAGNGPVSASLFVPNIPEHLTLISDGYSASEYGFMEKPVNEFGRYVVWSKRKDRGRQDLYYRMKVYKSLKGKKNLIAVDVPKYDNTKMPFFNEPLGSVIREIIEDAKAKSNNATSMAAHIISLINYNSDQGRMLLGDSSVYKNKAELICSILQIAKVPVRYIHGFSVDKSRRNVPFDTMIEIFDNNQWIPFNIETGDIGFPENFSIWHRGLEPVLIVEGGSNSSVTLSIIEEQVSAVGLAHQRNKDTFKQVFDFSLQSLPVESRNVFRGLFLVPIGALIVVLMRVVVGLPTSGTFMPILLAMAFRETELINGLVLFVIIVGIGLIIRSWLSRLNLLLVPRISSVVIVVVMLMAFLSVLSYRLGLNQGLSITFFPMIILAWTIERMSIIWEEQGALNTMKQMGGCLFIAICVYLAMTNDYIEYLTFTFPELLFVILAVIMALGTYSGYRLSELFRFKSMLED